MLRDEQRPPVMCNKWLVSQQGGCFGLDDLEEDPMVCIPLLVFVCGLALVDHVAGMKVE